MPKKNINHDKPETAVEIDWQMLDELARQVDEVVKTHGESVFDCQKIRQMIIAIRNRQIDTLKQFANSGAFPFRINIRQALKLI